MSVLKKRSESLVGEKKLTSDRFLYSEESILAQLAASPITHGYYTLEFYTRNGRLSEEPTETLSTFYLYPSGGTLRDENMNIVLYDSAFDTYRGFVAP